MEKMTGLDFKIREVAERIRELREITGFTSAEMAQKTDVPLEEYVRCESGEGDLTFAFIYRCAIALGVDVTDIIEGQSPTLRSYTVTRAGKGQRIQQAHGMIYYGLASSFRKRISEPLYVRAFYSDEAQDKDIELTTHTGQECDIVISGSLMVQ
ncbi:MAG: acyl-CoA synthetase, partial [Clostridia bacterium]|nr:acyl-CoA synthetase [Clostridia bacterium]